MKAAAARTLVRYCRSRLDDQLRTVFIYDREDAAVVYIRDELRSTYTEDEFERFAAAARDVHEDLQASGMDQTALGDRLATVQVFENAYAFQFPGWEDGGVVASFDNTVGTQLHEFVQDCWREIAVEEQESE